MEEVIQWLISLPNFQELAVFLIFVVGVVPFIPIPEEMIMVPLFLATPEKDLENIKMTAIGAMVVAETIAHIFAYYLAKHHLTKILKMIGITRKQEKSEAVIMQRWGRLAFLFMPSIFFLTFLTDVAIVYFVHKKHSFESMFPFIVAGEVIRGLLFAYGIIPLI